MIFNSAVFLFFFALVYSVYWLLSLTSRPVRLQNTFLLAASWFFYGYWDWLFLSLLIFTSTMDYAIAIALERYDDRPNIRRVLITTSISVNLALLGTFKYYNFFASSFAVAMQTLLPGSFDPQQHSILLNLVLPVGISFYTFQEMAYTIDVFRRSIRAQRNFLDFALFVGFFPQLVAGPIVRAVDMLPQITKPRIFRKEDLRQGLWFILIGFFMKVCIADNLSPQVDKVFLPGRAIYEANPGLAGGFDGFQVLWASIAFMFQIYCDFAGYSNIAIGVARLMGFHIRMNFNMPEFAQNPSDLWRRWHISLSGWIRDYVYIPLGGSRAGRFYTYRNLLLAFALSGLWHGATWTFVLWGTMHGIWIVGHAIVQPYLKGEPRSPFARNSLSIARMVLTTVAMSLIFIPFRAFDAHHVWLLVRSLLSFPWEIAGEPLGYAQSVAVRILPIVVLDAIAYRSGTQTWVLERHPAIRATVYIVLLFSILVFGEFGKDVIYFAF